ncbi:MAG: hypothetical protein KDA24_18540 [Deltaproteobacteria bacterium]|nr:hypothetical protein [Deltaproteobacteria bacterium]
MLRILLPFLLLLGLSGCGLSSGQPCEVSGDGFTRNDPCEDTCVEWAVLCDDGTSVVPDICSGSSCTDDNSCIAGWGCAQINATDSVCLPETLCTSGSFGVGQPAAANAQAPLQPTDPGAGTVSDDPAGDDGNEVDDPDASPEEY